MFDIQTGAPVRGNRTGLGDHSSRGLSSLLTSCVIRTKKQFHLGTTVSSTRFHQYSCGEFLAQLNTVTTAGYTESID